MVADGSVSLDILKMKWWETSKWRCYGDNWKGINGAWRKVNAGYVEAAFEFY